MDGAGRIDRGRLRLLLASSSVAALLIGGGAPAWAGLPCQSGGISLDGVTQASVSNSNAISCIFIFNSTISGNVSNNSPGGVITAVVPTPTGISINNSTVTGAVTNSGSITANSGIGILITNNATVSGGISNSGSIFAGGHGIVVGGTASAGTTTAISSFGGGISNSGTIFAGGNGIFVGGNASGVAHVHSTNPGTVTLSSFGGGITNSGIITAGGNGIFVGGAAFATGFHTSTVTVATVTLSTFTGAISNSGTIVASSGHGIFVGGRATGNVIPLSTTTAVFVAASVSLSNFSGGITNSGLIVAKSGHGIFVGGTALFGGSVTLGNFTGNIVNSRTITAAGNGIFVGGAAASFASVTISTFSGGITNSGTIEALGTLSNGIFVGGLAGGSSASVTIGNFTGNVTNSGVITSERGNGILVGGTATGLGVSVALASISNGITNTGTIFAGADGIFVGGGAFGSGASVTIANFSGGISNSGLISAFGHGIVVGGSATGVGSNLTISTFGGGITNTGTLMARNGDGIAVAGFASGGFDTSGVVFASSVALLSFGGNISNSGTILTRRTGILVGGFAGAFSSGTALPGNVTISNFSGSIVNSGTISARGDGIVVGGGAAGGTTFTHSSVMISTFGGGITNSGTIVAGRIGIGVGGTATSHSSVTILTFGGGITNTGTIVAGSVGILLGGSPGVATVQIATFQGNISNSGTIVAYTGIAIGSGVTFAPGSAIVNTGIIAGTGGIAINVAFATTPVTIDINGGAIIGNMLGSFGNGDTINFALGSGAFTYGAAYGFSGFDQVNVNSGTVILDGANSATNVAVNGGMLEIGDAANPGALLQAVNVAVSDGGTLAGNGTIDPLPTTTVTIDSGGTLEPGTPGGLGTLTIDGTLTFNAGSFYAVQVLPGAGANSATAVNGTANLNGNGIVVATPQIGRYSHAVYQILTTPAPADVTGTFAGLTVNADFVGSIALDYTTNPGDVDLDITGASLIPARPGANINQQNVINGINNGILNGPANVPLPPQFLALAGLTGPTFLNVLTHIDGEAATGAQTSAFQLMNEFLNLLLDPSSVGGSGGGGPLGFAPEQASLPPEIALAYASVLKAPPPASFDQRWTTWGAAFGGSSTTDGNATIGSNTITAGDYGFAGGMEYHVDPSTLYGFALSGGGTNWNLAQGLGSGRSDTFQAGLYGKRYFGPAYVSGALAFANHWFTTNRIALGDQFTANFDGQSYAARLEGGYRFGLAAPAPGAIVGVTPYAALQTQWFHTPSYSETDLPGGGFGLSYNAMTANDTRSELGARFDDLTMLYGMPLILRGRLAWAHDWVSNPALDAAFQMLPGSVFTVYGATPPRDSALTTAGVELHISANWSALAKFDGQFASRSQTYTGSGTLRYSW